MKTMKKLMLGGILSTFLAIGLGGQTMDLDASEEGIAPKLSDNFWNGRAEGRRFSDGGPLFRVQTTKHIDAKVFQGIYGPDISGYNKYFGPSSGQTLNPMQNPVKKNIDRLAVCQQVQLARYAELYILASGEKVNCSNADAADSAPDVSQPREKEPDISFKRLMLAFGA